MKLFPTLGSCGVARRSPEGLSQGGWAGGPSSVDGLVASADTVGARRLARRCTARWGAGAWASAGRGRQQVESLLLAGREMAIGLVHVAETGLAADDRGRHVGQVGEIARQVAHIVRAVFDLPVVADRRLGLFRAGLVRCRRGERVGHFGAGIAGLDNMPLALDAAMLLVEGCSPGQALKPMAGRSARIVGWLSLMAVIRSSARHLSSRQRAVLYWACSASAVTGRPARSSSAGISLVLRAISIYPSIRPLHCFTAATSMRLPSAVCFKAPRTSLPSMQIAGMSRGRLPLPEP